VVIIAQAIHFDNIKRKEASSQKIDWWLGGICLFDDYDDGGVVKEEDARAKLFSRLFLSLELIKITIKR